jgi:hypothetical protein
VPAGRRGGEATGVEEHGEGKEKEADGEGKEKEAAGVEEPCGVGMAGRRRGTWRRGGEGGGGGRVGGCRRKWRRRRVCGLCRRLGHGDGRRAARFASALLAVAGDARVELGGGRRSGARRRTEEWGAAAAGRSRARGRRGRLGRRGNREGIEGEYTHNETFFF